jgi:hypothetical protein
VSSPFSNPAGQARESAAGYVAALLELVGARDPMSVQRELLPELHRLTADLDDEALRRPEAPGKWSAQQVVEHLADQETVNAFRLRSIVAEDRPVLRGYDQDRWASRLGYGDAPLDEVLNLLSALRARNLRLYARLGEAELDRVGVHDERGDESARRLRALTAAHDLLHRRQLERIRRVLGRPDAAAPRVPFTTNRELAIHVFDVARAEAFYARVLGARVVSRDDESVVLDTGALRLYVNRDFSTPRSYVPSFDVADRAAARRHLETAGCRTVSMGPGVDDVYFCDPFGNVFDIVERR